MAALALGRAAAGRPPEPLTGQLLQHRLLAPRGQQLGALAGRHGLAPQQGLEQGLAGPIHLVQQPGDRSGKGSRRVRCRG